MIGWCRTACPSYMDALCRENSDIVVTCRFLVIQSLNRRDRKLSSPKQCRWHLPLQWIPRVDVDSRRVNVNEQLFPIAFIIVEGKNSDSQGLFMACIRVRMMQRPESCMISDRVTFINNEYMGWCWGHAHHQFYVLHLASYFHYKFHDNSLKMLLVRDAIKGCTTSSTTKWNDYLG